MKRLLRLGCWTLLVLVLLGQAFAEHSLTVKVAKASDAPASIVVGNTFDLDVFISAGTTTTDLWSALLRLSKGNENFNFVSAGNVASSVFNPLIQNGVSGGVWVMEGSDLTSGFSLTSTEALLGKVRVTAIAAGPIALNLAQPTTFAQAIDEVGDVSHTFAVTLTVDTITIEAADGGATCPSSQTSCSGSCVDTSTSNTNCGSCGNVCGVGQNCISGICETFTLSSTVISNNGAIPIKYTCDGQDISPPLTIANPPSGTATFDLRMKDTSANNFLHWSMNIPGTTVNIIEGQAPEGATVGANYFSNNGYNGPCPVAEDSTSHTYIFNLKALDNGGGHLGTATLTGTYQRASVQAVCGDNDDVCASGSSQSCTTATGYAGTQSCNADCTAFGSCVSTKSCGDGTKNGPEECDNGGANSDNVANACRTDCTAAGCGDGVVDTGEQCDDGNTNNDDGCSSTCATEATTQTTSGCGNNDDCANNPTAKICLIPADATTGTCVQCTQASHCAGANAGKDCLANKCTDILTTVRNILDNTSTSILAKISAIAQALRQYFAS